MTALTCDVFTDEGKCGRELVDRGDPTQVRRIAAGQGWTRQKNGLDRCDDHSSDGGAG